MDGDEVPFWLGLFLGRWVVGNGSDPVGFTTTRCQAVAPGTRVSSLFSCAASMSKSSCDWPQSTQNNASVPPSVGAPVMNPLRPIPDLHREHAAVLPSWSFHELPVDRVYWPVGLSCANTDVNYPGRNHYSGLSLAKSNSRAWQHGTCMLCLMPSSRVRSMLSLGEFDRGQPEKTADPDLQPVPFCLGRYGSWPVGVGQGSSFFAAHTVPGCLILTVISHSGYSGSIASVEKPGSL